jgi:hypothetical protein
MILMQNGMEICTADNLHVASTDSVNFSIEENVEHAALIVRAVNSHAELLAAANGILGLLQLIVGRRDMPDGIAHEIIANHRTAALKAAIANAEKTP